MRPLKAKDRKTIHISEADLKKSGMLSANLVKENEKKRQQEIEEMVEYKVDQALRLLK